MFQKISQLIIWKKTGLKGVVIFFSVDFDPIDTNDILDIHKYLMKRTYYKIMFGLITGTFIGLLTGLVNGPNHTKWVSWLIYILMNTVKNFPTIHLRLNWIDLSEVVILWMIYLIKYVFQMKRKIWI